MAQLRIDDRAGGIRAQPATPHLVRGEDGAEVRSQRRLVDLAQVRLAQHQHRVEVQRLHAGRAVRQMDPRERLHPRAPALVVPGREGIIELRVAVGAQRDGSAFLAVAEPVDHERDRDRRVGQQCEVRSHPRAKTRQRDPGQHRVQGRCLEEEPGPFAAVGEVVRGDALGRAVEGFDRLAVDRRHRHRRMQPGLLAHRTLLDAGAEEERRRVQGPAAHHHGAWLDADGTAGLLLRPGMEHLADHRHRSLAVPLDAPGAAVGVDGGALRDRVRQVGERSALLGVHRAAHPAVAGAQALAHVAPGRVDVPAELLAAVVQEAIVRVRVLEVHLGDSETLLYLLEMRSQRFRRNASAVLLAPAGDDVLRRTEAGGPVDHGAAADGAPLQDRHGEIGRRPVPAVLVQARVGRRFLHVELGLGVVATLLEHDHARARRGEPRRHDGAARPAADDADVGFQDQVSLDVRAGDDATRGHLSAPERR